MISNLLSLVVPFLTVGALAGRLKAPLIFASRGVDVDGTELTYLTAGHGAVLILLHGCGETDSEWKRVIPALAQRFTVIAPNFPDGVDATAAAIRIHALLGSLGIEKAAVVGHDFGLAIAHAYAAQFPAEVEKLVPMNALLPGVERSGEGRQPISPLYPAGSLLTS